MQFENLSKRIERVEYESLNGHFYDTQVEAERASKLHLILSELSDNLDDFETETIIDYLLDHYTIEPKVTSTDG